MRLGRIESTVKKKKVKKLLSKIEKKFSWFNSQLDPKNFLDLKLLSTSLEKVEMERVQDRNQVQA